MAGRDERRSRRVCGGATAVLLAASCWAGLALQTAASEGGDARGMPEDSRDEGVLFTDSVQFSSADLARGEEASDTVSAGEQWIRSVRRRNYSGLIFRYHCR